MAAPVGSTKVAAVIGDPIAHSLSPVIFNAAFDATELDWVFVAFQVARGDTGRAFDGARAMGIRGLSVTMPHKDAAFELVGRGHSRSEGARRGQLRRESRRHRSSGTTRTGTASSPRSAADGVRVAGERVGVLGAGGAARSVIAALGRAGAEVVVVNRSADKAAAAAALGGARCSVGGLDDVEKASRSW